MKNIKNESLGAVRERERERELYFKEIKNRLGRRNNGGITLVSLVITIVVLVILASISIAILTRR